MENWSDALNSDIRGHLTSRLDPLTLGRLWLIEKKSGAAKTARTNPVKLRDIRRFLEVFSDGQDAAQDRDFIEALSELLGAITAKATKLPMQLENRDQLLFRFWTLCHWRMDLLMLADEMEFTDVKLQSETVNLTRGSKLLHTLASRLSHPPLYGYDLKRVWCQSEGEMFSSHFSTLELDSTRFSADRIGTPEALSTTVRIFVKVRVSDFVSSMKRDWASKSPWPDEMKFLEKWLLFFETLPDAKLSDKGLIRCHRSNEEMVAVRQPIMASSNKYIAACMSLLNPSSQHNGTYSQDELRRLTLLMLSQGFDPKVNFFFNHVIKKRAEYLATSAPTAIWPPPAEILAQAGVRRNILQRSTPLTTMYYDPIRGRPVPFQYQ